MDWWQCYILTLLYIRSVKTGHHGWLYIRAATIHQTHDTIQISILGSRYDTYLDTFKCNFTGKSTIELQRTSICLCLLKLLIIISHKNPFKKDISLSLQQCNISIFHLNVSGTVSFAPVSRYIDISVYRCSLTIKYIDWMGL